MFFKYVIKLFNSGNVCVTGLRGSGKDVLIGNVVARSKKSYISNVDYTHDTRYLKLDFDKIDMGGNSYNDLISGNIKPYIFPYPLGCDIYISDVGVYFPSQYNNILNNKYPNIPTYCALSRQVSHNNVHFNVQNLNRAWDKLREQSDIYIRCKKCFVFFGFVFQTITIYDRYESCLKRVKPCRIRPKLVQDSVSRNNSRLHLDKFIEDNGIVKDKILIYRNKSKHDTYYFEKLFSGGSND